MFDTRKIQAIKNVQNLKVFKGSLRAAIKDAGYSQSIADNPKVITDSKWFKAALPDYEDTATGVKDLLHASRLDHYTFPLSMTDEEIQELIEALPGCTLRKIKHGDTMTWAYFWTPDNKSKKEAIDIILKVKGDYAPVKTQNVDPYESLSDEQLDEELRKAEREKQDRRAING